MTVEVRVTKNENSNYDAYVVNRTSPTYRFQTPSAFGNTPNVAIKNLQYCLGEIGLSGEFEYTTTGTLSFGKREISQNTNKVIFKENVTSFTDPNVEYEVTFHTSDNTYECTCPDFQNRRKDVFAKCKHINKAVYGVDSDLKFGE